MILMEQAKKYALKKEIGLFEATLYGVGIILGAGIYAMVGAGAQSAGSALWLAFLVGAVIAALTGLSYAELSSMFSKEAAEFVYAKNAFKLSSLAFIVQWIMLAANVLSASVVALGFAGYFNYLLGGNTPLIAAILIVCMSLINFIGMKQSSRFNVIATLIETLGLLGIIVLGIYYFSTHDVLGSIDWFSSPTGFSGILTATTLVYFAFIGFENLVNMSEETKNPEKTIPKALIISLIISTVIYVLVSISAVGILGADVLGQSKAPLAETAEKVIPKSSFILSIIALFATANTVLIMLIVSSRLLYGLSSNSMLPAFFSKIGKGGTPYYSVVIIGILSMLSLFIADIKGLAHIVNLAIFVVYIFVNLSLIVLRFSHPKMKRPFRTPLSIGKLPLLPVLAILLNLGMMFFFELYVFILGTALSIIGFLLYLVSTVYLARKQMT